MFLVVFTLYYVLLCLVFLESFFGTACFYGFDFGDHFVITPTGRRLVEVVQPTRNIGSSRQGIFFQTFSKCMDLSSSLIHVVLTTDTKPCLTTMFEV